MPKGINTHNKPKNIEESLQKPLEEWEWWGDNQGKTEEELNY